MTQFTEYEIVIKTSIVMCDNVGKPFSSEAVVRGIEPFLREAFPYSCLGVVTFITTARELK